MMSVFICKNTTEHGIILMCGHDERLHMLPDSSMRITTTHARTCAHTRTCQQPAHHLSVSALKHLGGGMRSMTAGSTSSRPWPVFAEVRRQLSTGMSNTCVRMLACFSF